MISTDTIRSGVGVIGNGISLGLFLSPLPTFIGIVKKKDTEDFSPIPYLATLLNCMLWVFYGIVVPHNTLVWTINGAGLVLESAYLSLFFWYAPNKSRVKVMKILAVELLFILGVVLGVMLGAHQAEKKKLIVGILCVIFGTIMYASPLSVMRMVIRTKSVEYMPFLLSLASFLNGICWTTYAILRFDLNIIIPNGLGTLFGLAQLILYACYKKTTPKKGSSSSAKTDQLELPTVNPEIVRQGSPK